MISYFFKFLTGTFHGLDTKAVSGVFGSLLADPMEMGLWMAVTVIAGFLICSLGLRNGLERITKWMMGCLFVLILVLAVHSMLLPGAKEGLAFYLLPDFERAAQVGLPNVITAAMNQSFFTLSLGIGAMEIFGSYMEEKRTLAGESVSICILDTYVALSAGLIIFPACFAYGVTPDSGPSLVFVTLPLVFAQMPLGSLWGALFFIFMSFAALSTVIAVFENLISFSMDKWEISRRRAVAINGILVLVLSLPCALGFNVLSDVTIPAIGDIQSIEDFIVSNNMLPLGALVFVLFCTRRYGWGWDNFLKEADTGIGIKFPAWSRIWVSYGIPVLIVIIFIMGYAPKIAFWLGLS